MSIKLGFISIIFQLIGGILLENAEGEFAIFGPATSLIGPVFMC